MAGSMGVPVLSLIATVPGPGIEPKKAALADLLPRTAMKKMEREVEPTSLRKRRRLSSLIPLGMTSPSSATESDLPERSEAKTTGSASFLRLPLRRSSLPR
ncbi:MAG: hypothetical protein UX62_C0048G0006 [Microgenomates group bacterium GW2011_GWA2_46_7]|nr:MAG: hypothetical protein UX62_C0048G0006 [Microgenomates group bacterium GW2011_GWA2_46_7]